MNPRPRKLQVLRWLPNRWVLTRGVRRRRVLHLTFDDGPHPEHTPALLDLLAAHGARATFFLIGREAERHPNVVARILREGHAIGNHSWSHPQFERLDLAAQREEIERTDRLLQSFDGLPQHDFRPPRGVMPRPMVLDCVRRGRRIAYWSYDSLDYSQRSAEELIASARRHPPRAGEILLMHDDGGLSLRLLETMLPVWVGEGFAFEPLQAA
ncbi:polysaccharide deacetylase family protein [Lysobacter hankyongensis]|uniref:polysaccharide deacetylase family protein n=1 Tax=Lysobacter hankyongensis TaxID=1176535 RepID=UPI0031E67B6C